MQIKALACELPATRGLPLSQLSGADIVRETQPCAIVARRSGTTVWRWLHEDAIRPWQHRAWIFPRDPRFALKAGRILDRYARCWEGKRLRADEFVLSTDEKTRIQARVRKHPALPPRPGCVARVEHEYARAGACPLAQPDRDHLLHRPAHGPHPLTSPASPRLGIDCCVSRATTRAWQSPLSGGSRERISRA